LGLRGITNSALLKALEKVPHGAFVIPGAITNGAGWSMESPYGAARVSECLDPHPTERLLQLGIGSGYEAAVLAELFRAVYAVEPRAEVVRQARANLELSGCTNNIFVRQGELAAGWLEASPFDKIIFNGSPEQLSTALIYQLKEGGRLVIAVDEEKAIQVFEKAGGVLNPRGSVPLLPTPLSLSTGPRLLRPAPTER
jgi:protein-L-isoaspartate(D-aspartate) O-methyltransferase